MEILLRNVELCFFVETADDGFFSSLHGDDDDDPELFSHPSGRDG